MECQVSLNPYSNGILSDKQFLQQLFQCSRLNPYSNGILSDFLMKQVSLIWPRCLNPYSNGILSDVTYSMLFGFVCRLNPYSNGILSDYMVDKKIYETRVLILILMEYSLTVLL